MAHASVPGGLDRPPRILSLDGGGIRGKSSLLILENIMEGVRDAQNLDHVPKPCDFFDLIGGTSTGGIIAIMLGRLSMTIDECIRVYDRVAEAAFTRKRNRVRLISSSVYSSRALETVIQEVVKEFCTEELCATKRSSGQSTIDTCEHSDLKFRSGSCTKTAVLAITKNNVDAAPIVFSTYDTSTPFNSCTIWEIARATSAATTYFKPIKLGRDNIEFIDAGFGCNNPCGILIEEAQQQFPQYRRDQFHVLSIGTGLTNVVEIKDSLPAIVNALKKMTTTSNQVARDMDRLYGDKGRYHRFSVDRGLEDVTISDWKKMSKVVACTRYYLMKSQKDIERAINSLVRDPQVVDEPRGSSTGTNAHFIVPFPKNSRFVDRDTVIERLEEMLFKENCQQVAVAGLGGIGKTQVAIRFAYWMKENKPEYSVLWAPALSYEAFEQAYEKIAKTVGIRKSGNEDIKDLVRDYLSSNQSGKWFMIIDNADEMELVSGSHGSEGIKRYFPRSENGLTLFTTRSREVAQARVENNFIELREMSPLGALEFFKISFGRTLNYDEEAAKELTHELAYLPLAIKQAVAYLNVKKLPIREYLRLLRNTEQDMVGLMSREFEDDSRYPQSEKSANAVAITWIVSFDQIQKSDNAAALLLQFISHIEPKSIPLSILPISQEWQLQDAVGTLCAYDFITRREDRNIFDMHRLVHLGARIWIQTHELTEQTMHEAICHLDEIFPSDDYENRELWRSYMPHALRVCNDSRGYDLIERYQLMCCIGSCLLEDGRLKEYLPICQENCRWAREHLPKHDKFRLRLEHNLGHAYYMNYQYEEAIEILEPVVEIRKELLPEDDRNRLITERVLAAIYIECGRVKEATQILERIIPISRKIFNEHDRTWQNTEDSLARIYSKTGRTKEAIEIYERVVEARKALPQDHNDLLQSEHNLAHSYLDDGRVKEAISLLEHVVAIQKTLPEDHSSRLKSEHELARAYLKDGLVEEAILLFEHVVGVRKAVLPEEHRNRLASEHALADAYLRDGRIEEAIELLEHVVDIEGKTLENDEEKLVSRELLEEAYRMRAGSLA
ncbi:acyl transferase/acyl hydrolase/lysophospholipase [Annulohypoxylon nitens]|nr:acyl transferase/acyl hydrolase/lysophospholipase [Annulohypoxylon nitens]